MSLPALVDILSFLKGPACAAIGTSAFSVLFGLRVTDAVLASLGAAGGWSIMQVMPPEASIAFSSFVAAFVSGLYSEIVARFRHRPATVYMISSIIPLVPGGGMYYTMLASVEGKTSQSLEIGMTAMMTAFSIAAGLAVANSLDKLILKPLFGRIGPRTMIGSSGKDAPH